MTSSQKSSRPPQLAPRHDQLHTANTRVPPEVPQFPGVLTAFQALRTPFGSEFELFFL